MPPELSNKAESSLSIRNEEHLISDLSAQAKIKIDLRQNIIRKKDSSFRLMLIMRRYTYCAFWDSMKIDPLNPLKKIETDSC